MANGSFEYALPSATYVDIPDPLDKIAFVSHNCYQVSLKSHGENATFVGQLVTNRHLAMAEHYVFTALASPFLLDPLRKFNSPFIRFDPYQGQLLLSYSIRPLIENATNPDPEAHKVISALTLALPQECQRLVPQSVGMASPFAVKPVDDGFVSGLGEPLRDRHRFVTYALETDRGVTHELVRHRLCSFAQESTRYCNYSRNRFGDKITIIKPLDYVGREALYDQAFQQAAESYFALLKAGALAQQARAVLPNGLRAKLVISTYMDEWRHIFDLRLAHDAHPEARRVLWLVEKDMERRGFLPAGSYKEDDLCPRKGL